MEIVSKIVKVVTLITNTEKDIPNHQKQYKGLICKKCHTMKNV